MSDNVLRFPKESRSVGGALAEAAEMDLPDVLILSQKDDGSLVFLSNGSMTLAHTNWLLDRAKWRLHTLASKA